MRKLLPILLIIFAGVAYSTFSITDAQPTINSFRLGYTIDVPDLPSDALSIAVDTDSGYIYLGVDNSGSVEFAELAPDGTLLNTYAVPAVEVDNSGLTFDPLTGNFFLVSGYVGVNQEPIIEINKVGETISERTSTVQEGTGLTLDPVSGHLFISDMLNSSIKEFELVGDESVEINSFSLPSIIPASADAGIAINPSNSKLVVSGETLQRGVIFQVNQDGTMVEEFLTIDNNGQGVLGLAFDDDPFRLYVLSGRGSAAKILVYGEFDDGVTVTPPPGPTSTPTPTTTPTPTSTPTGNCCSVYIAFGLSCTGSRVSAAFKAIDTIDTYTRFRDETLRTSDVGAQLIDIYNQNTGELAAILLSDTDLRNRTGQFLTNAADEFETLLPSSTNSAVLSQELYDEANQLVVDLAAAGSPEFESQMQQLWSELALEQHIGQSTTAIWAEIQHSEIYLPFITR